MEMLQRAGWGPVSLEKLGDGLWDIDKHLEQIVTGKKISGELLESYQAAWVRTYFIRMSDDMGHYSLPNFSDPVCGRLTALIHVVTVCRTVQAGGWAFPFHLIPLEHGACPMISEHDLRVLKDIENHGRYVDVFVAEACSEIIKTEYEPMTLLFLRGDRTWWVDGGFSGAPPRRSAFIPVPRQLSSD